MKNMHILTATLLFLSLSGIAQQGIVRNDIAPEKAIYQRQDGGVLLTFRDTYTYDEYEYFLTEVLTELEDLGTWVPYSRRTYEYDYSNRPITIVTERWDNGWVNQDQEIINYNGNSFPPQIHTQLLQTWQNNNWVNVTQRIYDYEEVMTILVKDWITDHWGNHYLYTYTPNGEEETILLQFWKDGAWQNQEQDLVTYNSNREVKEIVHTVWDLPNWNNETLYQYEYDGPYQLSRITITQWDNGGWSPTKFKTIHYTHDGMGNSLRALCESNYGGGEDNNTEIEMFYNEGQSILYENVCGVEMNYTDLTDLDEETTSRFALAPNPAYGYVKVLGEGLERSELYSLTGQKLGESQTPYLDLKGLASGTYLIKLYLQDGLVETHKLLVH